MAMKRLLVLLLMLAPLAAAAESPHDDAALAFRIRELSSADAGRRRAAVEALARIGDPAVPALRTVLDDPAWETRREAARALAAVGTSTAQPALEFAIQDRNWTVREAAARGLARGAALNAAATDSIWRVRGAACFAAARRDPAAVRRLVTDPVAEVREAAAAAIAATGDPEYRAEMRAMLAEPGTADAGLALFAKIGRREDADCIAGLFDSPDASLAARALRAAFDAGLDVVNAADRYVERTESLRSAAGPANQERFMAMLSGLETIGPPAWSSIAKRLDAADEAIAAEFAVILSRAGDPRTVPALKKLLAFKNADIRYLALNALDRVNPAEATEAAMGLLSDEALGVRVEAAVVLTRTADGRAALVEMWDKLDPSARRVAISALGRDTALETRGLMQRTLRSADAWERGTAHEWFLRHGDAQYLQDVEGHFAAEQNEENRCRILAGLEAGAARHATLVLRACDDGSAAVRLLAVRMLGTLREPAPGPALRRALGDSNPLVRSRALQILESIEGTADIEAFTAALLDPDSSVRQAAVRLVVRSPRAATLLPVAIALKDGEAAVRWSAVDAVGAFPEDIAALLLRETLRNDTDTFVRSAAARVAARFPACAEFLADIAMTEKSPVARAALVSAAAEAGGKGAAALLRRMASDDDAQVRAAVAMGMGRSPSVSDLGTLETLSGDADDLVRISAATAIGQVPGKEATAALWVCASDASDAVRGAALAGLVRRGENAAVTRWLQQDPRSVQLRTDVAAVLDEAGDSAQALSILCGRPDLGPEGLSLAGWCCVKLRLWDSARLFFQRAAIAGEPHDTGWDWAVLARAIAAADEGRPEAVGLIRTAVASAGDPVNAAGNAAYLLADSLLLPDLSLELAAQAAAGPDASPDAVDSFGWVQLRAGLTAEAEKTLTSLKTPPGAIGWLHRAIAQAANDHSDAAAASLREALSAQPSLARDARANPLLAPLFARTELENWK